METKPTKEIHEFNGQPMTTGDAGRSNPIADAIKKGKKRITLKGKWNHSNFESFRGCTDIHQNYSDICIDFTQVEFPLNSKGQPIVPEGAFENCTSLQEIVLPPNIAEFCNKAFAGCSNLETLNVPSTVRKMGAFAFCGVPKLRFLDIPANCLELGQNLFDSQENTVLLLHYDDVRKVHMVSDPSCGETMLNYLDRIEAKVFRKVDFSDNSELDFDAGPDWLSRVKTHEPEAWDFVSYVQFCRGLGRRYRCYGSIDDQTSQVIPKDKDFAPHLEWIQILGTKKRKVLVPTTKLFHYLSSPLGLTDAVILANAFKNMVLPKKRSK